MIWAHRFAISGFDRYAKLCVPRLNCMAKSFTTTQSPGRKVNNTTRPFQTTQESRTTIFEHWNESVTQRLQPVTDLTLA